MDWHCPASREVTDLGLGGCHTEGQAQAGKRPRAELVSG